MRSECDGLALTGGRQTVRNLTFEFMHASLWIGIGMPGNEQELLEPSIEGGHLIEGNTFRSSVNNVVARGESSEPIVIRNNRFVNTYHAIVTNGRTVHVLNNDISVPDADRAPRLAGSNVAIGVAPVPQSTGATSCTGNVIAGNRVEGHPNLIGMRVVLPGQSCRLNVIRNNTLVVSRERRGFVRDDGVAMVGVPLVLDNEPENCRAGPPCRPGLSVAKPTPRHPSKTISSRETESSTPKASLWCCTTLRATGLPTIRSAGDPRRQSATDARRLPERPRHGHVGELEERARADGDGGDQGADLAHRCDLSHSDRGSICARFTMSYSRMAKSRSACFATKWSAGSPRTESDGCRLEGIGELESGESDMNNRGRIAFVVGLTLCLGTSAGSMQAQPATNWRDPARHTARIITVAPGVKLEVLDWGGSGPPVILLAGLGHTAHSFDEFAPDLVDAFHVYAVTRRGYGASTRPDTGYTIATLTSDIVALLDSLGLSRVALVGHSIAGDEMSRLAAMHPARVTRLAYLDAAHDRTTFMAEVEAARATPPQPPMTSADSASPASVRAYYARLGAPVPESEIRAMHVFGSDGRLQRVLARRGVGTAIIRGVEAPAYAKITVPALAIYPVADSIPIPVYSLLDSAGKAAARRAWEFHKARGDRQRDRFQREVAQGRVELIRDAGHFVHLTHQRQVIALVRAFLSQSNLRQSGDLWRARWPPACRRPRSGQFRAGARRVKSSPEFGRTFTSIRARVV